MKTVIVCCKAAPYDRYILLYESVWGYYMKAIQLELYAVAQILRTDLVPLVSERLSYLCQEQLNSPLRKEDKGAT